MLLGVCGQHLCSEVGRFRLDQFPVNTYENISAIQFCSAKASGLRMWSIRGFQNNIDFYRPLEDGVDVVRVIHGARDIQAIFDESNE